MHTVPETGPPAILQTPSGAGQVSGKVCFGNFPSFSACKKDYFILGLESYAHVLHITAIASPAADKSSN